MKCNCGYIGLKENFYSTNTCKKCKQKTTKQWQKDNPEAALEINRRKNAKSKYGVTLEEYNICLSSSNSCEICGKVLTKKNYDHDHTMPKDITAFRGVLCSSCNTGLGKLGDNIEGITKALEYLKRYEENKTDGINNI